MAEEKIVEAIKAIAAKNGVAVDANDPIMVMITLHELLISDSVKSQQQLLKDFQTELESISHRWGEDAKTLAERILNASIEAGKSRMHEQMQAGADAVANQVNKKVLSELQPILDEHFNKVARQGRIIAAFNLAAAAIAFIGGTAGFLFYMGAG